MFVHTDSLHKIAYATDASVYREIPYGVAYPETLEDVRALMALAREKGLDLIPRAGGTSIAGQVVGSGIVVDISKHWSRILEINEKERWARVQPGVVRDELNIALKPYGLFFSPETSTSNRCCIGGMFGNNSCGTHSLVYGSTRDHVVAAKGLLTDGSLEEFREYSLEELEARFGKAFWEREEHLSLIEKIYSQLIGFSVNKETAKLIAENYPDRQLKRRSCGYAIDEAIESLPSGINLCKLLSGSEGTLAFITEITVSLDVLPPKELMVVCAHCDSLEKSFEANLVALKHDPTAIELMDGDILELSKGNLEQQRNRFFVEGDPAALLITELRSDSREELDAKATALEKDLLASGLVYHNTRVYAKDVSRVWALRKAGLGMLSGTKGDAKPTGVIEDTAVAPARIPAYMKDLSGMLSALGARCVYYGHISTGELHLRPVLNLKSRKDRELFRTLARETALLVKKHRGTISGEHGDGRLRGEFIPLLYGEQTYELMRQVKWTWDPDYLLNRHKIVDTRPMDSMLRYDVDQRYACKTASLGLMRSIEQCNGAGDCRKSSLIGGTMCPAFKVSGDELMSTRARANVLREVLTRGGDDKLIKEVLDTCLACKGCHSECPSNVDMTRIRSEVLQQYYDRHHVPLRSWMVARMAQTEQFGRTFRPLYNLAASWGPSSALIKKIVGFSPERSIPRLSKNTARALINRENAHFQEQGKKKVYIFADEFTNQQEAELGLSFSKLLTRLGYYVVIPRHGESARAAISKGCQRLAGKKAERNVRLLKDIITQESPLVGIEPSCILSFRDEYPDLVDQGLRKEALRLGRNALLYDEFLLREMEEGRIGPDSFEQTPLEIFLHGHCHQKALVGVEATARVLRELLGAKVNVIPSGCCGMAGSFGYEKEHYKTSLEIGEMVLFPAVRKAVSGQSGTTPVVVAAPGTSCRQHILDGTGVKAVHPIEILYRYLKEK